MTAATPGVVPIVTRGEPRFSIDGRRGVCLASDDAGIRCVETWQSTSDGPVLTTRTAAVLEARMTQLAIRTDGHALLSCNEATGQYYDVITPDGERRRLGFTQTPTRVLSPPDLPGWLAVAATIANQQTVLYRLNDSEVWHEPIANIPGRVGGIRSTSGGIAVTSLVAGRPTPMLVDAVTGSVTPLLDAELERGAHVLLAGGGQILLGVPTDSGYQLGLVPEGGGPVRLLDSIPDLGGPVTPVALEPTGTRIALVVNRGPRGDLMVLDTESGSVRAIPAVPGTFSRTAAWNTNGLWLLASTSTRPAAFAWCDAEHADLRMPPAPQWRWPVQPITYPGPDGPIEALTCGPDWRTNDRVVVLLHGGPDTHWTLGFQRLWQSLADAGVTVIGPNQRGSTGYGPTHANAIIGAWGGPDLDDIRALGRHLIAHRAPGAPNPAICGMSYGAYLALLAVATDADLWSRCVAVAAFRSAPTLYSEATLAVRNLIDRLDGHTQIHDNLGPRDLDRLVDRIRTPVTLLHGALDETIPVEHSRHLAERLSLSGACDVRFIELPARGHAGIGDYATEPYAAHILEHLARAAAIPIAVT